MGTLDYIVPTAKPKEKEDAMKSTSRTVTETLEGEHEHTIVGYSLVKGVGDGEPIASERFTVGGHEWILLFYPDGKRSQSDTGQLNPGNHPHHPALLGHGGAAQGMGLAGLANPMDAAGPTGPGPLAGHAPGAARRDPGAGDAARDDLVRQQIMQLARAQQGPGASRYLARRMMAAAADRGAGDDPGAPGEAEAPTPRAGGGAEPAAAPPPRPAPVHPMPYPPTAAAAPAPAAAAPGNEYCALFVALIGEGEAPQGVLSTGEGRVVRAFHRFTLVDQTGRGGDVSKGRRRDQGAVKISCSRADPQARNCHGYRKFVKRSVLEDPGRGLLVGDTIVIRYHIQLVVSTGGALARAGAAPRRGVVVPPPSLGPELACLLDSGEGADVSFEVEGQTMAAHKILLQARSPVFKALLTGPMLEGQGLRPRVDVQGVKLPVFKVLLHFVYADDLPEELQDNRMEVAMAQHLLVAADRFQLIRLRGICEQRLCVSIEEETVATTLALAEQNNALELKRVCLEYVALHLKKVMATEGYQYLIYTCPQVQAELLQVISGLNRSAGTAYLPAGLAPVRAGEDEADVMDQLHHNLGVGGESSTEGHMRRVRARHD
ncbi:hypothetical protein ACKKBF_B32705 [Auxenochlorella protothecoides x Auxenochlorella symbiontica]